MTSSSIILSRLQAFAMKHSRTRIDESGNRVISGSVPVPDLLREIAAMRSTIPPSTHRTSKYCWPLIEEELHRAILLSTKSKFAGSKSAHDYIKNNPESFPLTCNVYSRTLKSWFTTYCVKMKWVQWTGKNSGTQKIFIISGRE